MAYDHEGIAYEIEVMSENVDVLAEAVIGHKIASVGRVAHNSLFQHEALEIMLDNGKRVLLRDTGDCCAYTELESFLLNASLVDHMIMGVAADEGFNTWHIYADMGEVLSLTVGWSSGNTGYYGFGFNIQVVDV